MGLVTCATCQLWLSACLARGDVSTPTVNGASTAEDRRLESPPGAPTLSKKGKIQPEARGHDSRNLLYFLSVSCNRSCGRAWTVTSLAPVIVSAATIALTTASSVASTVAVNSGFSVRWRSSGATTCRNAPPRPPGSPWRTPRRCRRTRSRRCCRCGRARVTRGARLA